MQQKHTLLFLIVVIIIPFSVYGVVKWYQNRFTALPVLGPPNHIVSDFYFRTQYNSKSTIQDWKNKIVVANFFFTHCSSICPKMMYQLKRVQAYADKNILLASFTVDPERDSVQRLKEYADQFGITRNWYLLTGNKKDLYRFARNDLMVVATDGDGGADDFIHSENVVLIDPQKRIRGYYKGTDEREMNALVSDIEKLKKEFSK